MGRRIDKIIVHCSDTPDSMDIGSKEINQWHKERGWLSKKSEVSIGYHYVVTRKGNVEIGRLEEEVGSHCYGQNRTSLGVCWVGRDNLTLQQDSSFLKLLRKLINKYDLKPSDVYGHCEFSDQKTCPNISMHSVRMDLLFQNNELADKKIIDRLKRKNI